MRDRRLAPVPSLVRRSAVESLSGRVVEDVDSHHHRLSPEDSRHSPLLEEGSSHPHNRLLAPLDDVVLLRAVRRGLVVLNTLIHAVLREFNRHCRCEARAACRRTLPLQRPARFGWHSQLLPYCQGPQLTCGGRGHRRAAGSSVVLRV
jgi:hypothetical protein